jgi:hypothetical protein
MPRGKCRKRIANFQNEGLKKQESFGNVEGSEKWKRIALPKLPLFWNSLPVAGHSAECLQLSEASDRFACYQNQFDKPHRSAGATKAPLPGEERPGRLRMESQCHTMMMVKPKGLLICSCRII